MTLRSVSGRKRAESAQDLQEWLRGLEGCPPVSRTVAARCEADSHGDDPGMWFYVEADAAAGVARMRCLGCGRVRPVLDSQERWSFPPTWACSNCSQSIGEVAFGVNENNGLTRWLVMGVRCVECGHVEGLTDLVVDPTETDELVGSL